MIAMQYKILLPDDYDMDVIRQRVAVNGYKKSIPYSRKS